MRTTFAGATRRRSKWRDLSRHPLTALAALIVLALVGAGVYVLARPQAAKPTLEITRIDGVRGSTAYYATFGSWDQHVVSNSGGIFVAYSYEDDRFHSPNYWRLARSTDGGKTFHVVYDARHEGSTVVPPTLETDSSGNVFVIAPTDQSGSWLKGPTIFYRFSAGTGYHNPLVRRLPIGGAGKYSSVYDPARGLIDLLFWAYAPNVPNFFSIDGGGVVRHRVVLFTGGRHAQPEYPNLTASADGTIFAGWTTDDAALWNNGLGTQNYYDAHFLASPDGGTTWLGKRGKVSLPAIGDDTGPAFQIVDTGNPVEFIPRGSPGYRGNWNVLMGFAYNSGYLDFFYGFGERHAKPGQALAARVHESYARMNWSTRTIDKRISPQFASDLGIRLDNAGGAFAEARSQTGRMYFAGAYSAAGGGRLVLLDSDDHGRTWHLYARGPALSARPGYVNTARDLTRQGYVIGSFTAANPKGNGATVYFFRSSTS